MPTKNLFWFGFAVVVSLGGCDGCNSDSHPIELDGGRDGGEPEDGNPGDGADGADGADGNPSDGDAGLDGSAGGPDSGASDAGTDAGGDASLDGGADAGADGGGLADAGSDAGPDGGEPVCVPVDETCNAVDDDCDGLTDEGLLEMSADDSQRVAMPESTTLAASQRAFSQLVRTSGDAAWLLTKPLATNDGASPVDVVALGPDGAPLGLSQAILPESRGFLAASDGNFLAVLWRATDADGDISTDDLTQSNTYLTLYEAASADPFGTLTKLDDFEIEGPADISELTLQRTAGGELRILAVYAPWNIASNIATLAPTVLHTLRYDTSGVPALATVSTVTLPADARPTVHALKIPCEEGWLVAYWRRLTTDLPGTADENEETRETFVRTLSLDGVMDLTAGTELLSLPGHALQGLAISEQCEADASPLLVVSDRFTAPPAHPKTLEARELSFDHTTGGLSVAGSALELADNATAFAHAARYGGEWYVTLRNFGYEPTGVFELNVLAGTQREIMPPFEQGGLSILQPVADVNMYFVPTHGVLALGEGLLVTFSNARPADGSTGMGTDAVAVTHRLGCPAGM